MSPRIALLFGLLASSILPSCGGMRFMRKPAEGEVRQERAPDGMALVNFHRPSNYAGVTEYEVFDRERLIGNSLGVTLFQYACEPGEHVFLGVADRASAIRAELAAGEVYDVVINVSPGFWKANITLEALDSANPKRDELAAWEEREELWIFVDDEAARARETERGDWARQTLEDFLGGSHAERLQTLGPGDERGD